MTVSAQDDLQFTEVCHTGARVCRMTLRQNARYLQLMVCSLNELIVCHMSYTIIYQDLFAKLWQPLKHTGTQPCEPRKKLYHRKFRKSA